MKFMKKGALALTLAIAATSALAEIDEAFYAKAA